MSNALDTIEAARVLRDNLIRFTHVSAPGEPRDYLLVGKDEVRFDNRNTREEFDRWVYFHLESVTERGWV